MPAQRGRRRNSAKPPRRGDTSARSSNKPAIKVTPAPRSPMREPISTRIRKVTRKNRGAISVAVPLALGALVTSANADPLQIVGYSGYLGEWELTATLNEDDTTSPRKYSGPFLMTHVGLCTQDGPEEKSGRIRVQIPSSSRLEATLWVDGVECGYQGILANFYNGTMKCVGREAVPL